MNQKMAAISSGDTMSQRRLPPSTSELGTSLHFTIDIGKYAAGSCGASGASSGIHLLYDVGGIGGRWDSEYAFLALVMVAMAAVRSTAGGRVAGAGAGTDADADASPGFPSVLPSVMLRSRRDNQNDEIREWVDGRDVRRLFRLLKEERRELVLRDHRQLRIRSPNVPFPIRVLRRVTRCPPTIPLDLKKQPKNNRATWNAPFVAGVAYFSGREPGWGYLFLSCRGRPLEISGLTTVTSRNFFQKPLGLRW